jgi:hypothetical protein
MQHLDLLLQHPMKHLQYKSVKHMQHPDKTHATSVWNSWNICNGRLQRTCIAIAIYATSRSTFATSIWNTCNMHMKHLKDTLATHACNIQGRKGAWGVAEEARSRSSHFGSRDVVSKSSVAAVPTSTMAMTSWWGMTAWTAPRSGEGQGMARRGGDWAWCDEAKWGWSTAWR